VEGAGLDEKGNWKDMVTRFGGAGNHGDGVMRKTDASRKKKQELERV
jgi:hypothetical protein